MAVNSYFIAFFWGICILFSLIGWGDMLNRVLFPKNEAYWAQKAAWGIAFSVFIGGILNATWSISPTVILTYIGLGFCYWLTEFYQTRKLFINSLSQYIQYFRKDRILLIGVLLVLFLMLLRYMGSIATTNFNGHDDYYAYFVFPNKMLQMGSMGPDPFSARRIVSSLGGQTFLDTFILSVLPERNLNIIDSGIGLIIAIGIILGFAREKKLTSLTTLCIILLFLFLPTYQVNITSIIIAESLYLSLFVLLSWNQLRTNHFLANGCMVTFITAALCAVKSTFIIPGIILFVLSYSFYIIESKFNKKAIYEFLFATGLLILFLLPWMISMYQSSGTFLWPLLGKGYHGSAYEWHLSSYSGLTIFKLVKIIINAISRIDFLVLLLLGFFILKRQGNKLFCRESIFSLLLSVGLGKIILSLGTGGYGIDRYSVSFVMPTLIILMIIALGGIEKENSFSLKYSKSIFITIFVAILVLGWFGAKGMYKESLSNIKIGLKNFNLFSTQEAVQYNKMLQAIPPQETILTRLEKPFLLDFRRKVFIADIPGGSSLPPGMPFFKGSEALADYLVSKSIRYVAYSYANEAGFRFEELKNRLQPNSFTWFQLESQQTFDFQNNLRKLGETRKRIYDDGENFVLDLLNHSGGQQI